MKNKRGAMELSVTAIVVLILAIVMLGLGLGFIRGMFSKVSSQVEQQVTAEPEPAVPSALEPITLSRESVITRAGEKEVMKISVFNPSDSTWVSVSPSVSCIPPLQSINQSAQTNPKNVEQGKVVTFNLIMTLPASAPNTYLCQMSMQGYDKDFTIKITE